MVGCELASLKPQRQNVLEILGLEVQVCCPNHLLKTRGRTKVSFLCQKPEKKGNESTL